MAILKRRSISITHEYRDVYEFLEKSRYNLSKYVCDLIREDIKKNKELYNATSSSNKIEEDDNIVDAEDKEEIVEEVENTDEEDDNDDIKDIDPSWLG